ncbi:MAG TPA: IPT/TIG domain-containing protein, partial [Cyclobacteriaceae bacterium]|nr:IPT/TIG domain-containing protein [Cyclobacteriaceae bacterium]
ITDFTPTSGIVGSTVTINGTGFSETPANNLVNFNGATALVTAATTASLTVTVPSQASTGKIAVAVGGSTATSSSDFTLLAPPMITGFIPASGIVGNSVTISGTNFSDNAADNEVKFNGTTATITSATSTQLVVTVPQDATTGTISVAIGTAVATSNDNFTILAPTITSFSPNIGATGTLVVITGTNFSPTSANNIVKFNSTAAIVTQATATSITATVMPGVTTGKITVKVGKNTATSTTDFQACAGAPELVISNLVISSISANRTSFVYDYDLSNVGDLSADLSSEIDQAYVSTDNADNGGDLAASGWTIGGTLNPGQTKHLQFNSNIFGGGTVDAYPYLVLKISGIAECNTANNTVIKSILN